MNIKCPIEKIKEFNIRSLLDGTTKAKFVKIINKLLAQTAGDKIEKLDEMLDINGWWKDTLKYYRDTKYDGTAIGPNVILNGSFKVIYNVGNYATSVELGNMSMATKRSDTFFMLKEKFVNEECLIALPEDQKIIQADNNYDRCLIVTKWEKCVMDGFDLFEKLKQRRRTTDHISMMNRLHYDLGKALKKIHNKGVYILDLKPENMLLCNNKLKYADLDDVILKENLRKAVVERINNYGKNKVKVDSLTCVKEIVTPEFSLLLLSDIFACFKRNIELLSRSNINKAVELYCSLYAYIDWYAWSMIVCLNEPKYLNIFISEEWDQTSIIPPVLRKSIVDDSDYNPKLDVLTNIELYTQYKYNEMQKALNFMAFFIDQYVYWQDDKCNELDINVNLVEPVKWIESSFDSSKSCIEVPKKKIFKLTPLLKF